MLGDYTLLPILFNYIEALCNHLTKPKDKRKY